jgi:hypothetical protein
MKKLKFDYIKIGSHKRPIIPVRLSYNKSAVNVPALIDSGADFNVFHLSIAKDLGLNLSMNKPIIFGGVGEKSQKLTGYLAVLDLMIFNKGESINFSTPIVFTNDIPSNGFSLLGEVGFFDHLEQISFFYKRGKISLES